MQKAHVLDNPSRVLERFLIGPGNVVQRRRGPVGLGALVGTHHGGLAGQQAYAHVLSRQVVAIGQTGLGQHLGPGRLRDHFSVGDDPDPPVRCSHVDAIVGVSQMPVQLLGRLMGFERVADEVEGEDPSSTCSLIEHATVSGPAGDSGSLPPHRGVSKASRAAAATTA